MKMAQNPINFLACGWLKEDGHLGRTNHAPDHFARSKSCLGGAILHSAFFQAV